MSCQEQCDDKIKYKGVRRRRWGKWVSEIRVPGSRERLWLGSYSTPEAAAAAHDTAVFFLRGPESSDGLNFPSRVAGVAWAALSPPSVQRAASNAGMAVDAQLATYRPEQQPPSPRLSSRKPEGEDGSRVRRDGGAQGSGKGHEFNDEVDLDVIEFYLSD